MKEWNLEMPSRYWEPEDDRTEEELKEIYEQYLKDHPEEAEPEELPFM